MGFAEQLNEIIHWNVNLVGIVLNLTLMYMVLRRTPVNLRTYAVFIFNFAITDFGACVTAIFVMQRIIPFRFNLSYISYGPCTYFGEFHCYVGYAFMLHFYAHALHSMALSFFYRFYVLIRHAPNTRQVAAACLLLYIPSLFQALSFTTASSDTQLIRSALHENFPEYNLTNAVVTGHLSIFEPWTLFTILYMTMPCGPVYCIILYSRRKVYKCLESAHMSEKTKQTHKQLMKALSLQACLPSLFSLAVLSYGTEQLNIYHHPVLEYFVFQIVGFIPAVSPILSLYFITPYRHAILKSFGRMRKQNYSIGSYSTRVTSVSRVM